MFFSEKEMEIEPFYFKRINIKNRKKQVIKIIYNNEQINFNKVGCQTEITDNENGDIFVFKNFAIRKKHILRLDFKNSNSNLQDKNFEDFGESNQIYLFSNIELQFARYVFHHISKYCNEKLYKLNSSDEFVNVIDFCEYILEENNLDHDPENNEYRRTEILRKITEKYYNKENVSLIRTVNIIPRYYAYITITVLNSFNIRSINAVYLVFGNIEIIQESFSNALKQFLLFSLLEDSEIEVVKNSIQDSDEKETIKKILQKSEYYDTYIKKRIISTCFLIEIQKILCHISINFKNTKLIN
ncbi:hypothetical protein EDEG_00438 [Edhazardia aedis USNM 41457]|uniref:Uncharacterized protein n=1 Tax=Edhazardia aedis (strain USNM 41457) TaxID=1003232 RepID=J8ZP57_EDHAE|nr:hypothetical protein EDEG_00438 [Edhazardia aedis USNM 41457]|eukprot:EJW01493.1 hypothetical protein EDEG_00438 [Edhazardia aedis USNM 41457]